MSSFGLLRWVIVLVLSLAAMVPLVQAQAPQGLKRVLTIHSATDRVAFEALITAFENANPDIAVDYREFQSQGLYASLTEAGDPYERKPSLVISSAMDLQTRLVNDGLALPLAIEGDTGPDWASWRNEIWGFTFEPVVMVFNRKSMQGLDIPGDREALLQLMRERPALFAAKVGTYDIAISGAGYLFASQDAIQSSLQGRLLEALGRAQARTYCCSNEILDALSDGQLVLGYNLIGSYAIKRALKDPNLVVVMPKDYTLVMSRLAFVPKSAPEPLAAKAFVEFLLSDRGQDLIAKESGLIAIRGAKGEPMTEAGLRARYQTVFRPIEVGPPLMLYLDGRKRTRFLDLWRSALFGRAESMEGLKRF